MRRTGLIIEFRHCPRHCRAMELALDESRPAFSPLFWWCSDCRGFWSEEYFNFQAEKALPIRALEAAFVFPCPKCGSLETEHACVVGCCEGHFCRACGHGFELLAEIHEAHPRPVSPRPFVECADSLCYGTGGGVAPSKLRLLGVSLDSRRCTTHTASQLELALNPTADKERHRLGWYCQACQMFFFDYRLGRAQRPIFVPPGLPGVECPVCFGSQFDSLPDVHFAKCQGCDTVVRLRAVEISAEEEPTPT